MTDNSHSPSFRKDIAKIRSTMLGYEGHGILTVMLDVEYGGGSCQGVGGYGLDEPRRDDDGKFVGRFGTAFGMEFVCRTMRACGVERWEDLPGRTIFVLQDLPEGSSPLGTSRVMGIENLPPEPGERFVFHELSAEFGLGGPDA